MLIEHGSRVTHRRYPWMVGTVVSEDDDAYVKVAWATGLLQVGTYQENLSDLRATPIQPERTPA